MKRFKLPLYLLLISLCVRLFYYFLDNPVISSDAADYVKLARHLSAGDFAGGISTYWAPLFPFLIAVPSIFTDSYLLPTLIVSIVAGSFAAVATYYLIEQSSGQEEAVIAAIIAIFYPHLLRSTFNLGTENVYLLLIAFTLIKFWKGLRDDSFRDLLFTGALLGLAYLTRPEAFGYLFFFIPWLGLDKFLSGQQVFTRKLFIKAALLFFGFSVVAAPYIFYLRQETGNWTISAKFKRHVVGDEVFSDRQRLYADALQSPHPAVETSKTFIKLTLFNLNNIHKKIPYLLPPFLLIFIGVGLFRTNWTGSRFKREAYLLSFCAATILGYALTVNEISYFYVLLPILIGWIARGIVEMENWWRVSAQILPINKLVASKAPVFSILLIILINIYIFPLHNFMRSRIDAWEWSRYEQKQAGLWLKENSKPAPIIMSADFRPAFYAQGEHIPLSPHNSIETIREAVSRGADFLIIDERNIKNTPQVIGLLNGTENRPELETVYQAEDQPGYKIVIYRVRSENLRLPSAAESKF